MIVIVDYGVGNLQSVERMLNKAGATCELSADPDKITQADKLILPGVGNFGHCVDTFRASTAFEAVNRFALEARKPLLGICVGGQMLGRSSEESPGSEGLGWLDFECRRFPASVGRVPHMGWGHITPQRESALLPELTDESRFYFVHSYYMDCADPDITLATVEYGITYCCAVNKDNIYGVQFHPEKSLRHGLALMNAFATL